MKKRRMYLVLIAGAVVLSAAVGVCVLLFSSDGAEEELSPDEQFVRDTVRSFDPTQSTLQRLAVVRRAAKNLGRIPRARRQELMIKAMAAGANGSIDAFRALPESEKPERARLLYQDALRTRDFYRSMSAKDRRRAREILYGNPKAQQEVARMVRTVINKLTPDENRMLSPVFQTWQSMLKEK